VPHRLSCVLPLPRVRHLLVPTGLSLSSSSFFPAIMSILDLPDSWRVTSRAEVLLRRALAAFAEPDCFRFPLVFRHGCRGQARPPCQRYRLWRRPPRRLRFLLPRPFPLLLCSFAGPVPGASCPFEAVRRFCLFPFLFSSSFFFFFCFFFFEFIPPFLSPPFPSFSLSAAFPFFLLARVWPHLRAGVLQGLPTSSADDRTFGRFPPWAVFHAEVVFEKAPLPRPPLPVSPSALNLAWLS